jgi:CDP-glucose 4,6-dehydratase
MGIWKRALENLVMNAEFWKDKKVLITGHTGFKGSWLSLWLQQLGASVVGFALTPPSEPNLFTVANVAQGMQHVYGDVRDLTTLQAIFIQYQPEIVYHMAAQSLVQYSYDYPVDTYATNVLGTVNLFEAVRKTNSVKAVINVTSDKCYENKEWCWGYRENENLGGHDPYSNSKACAELVTSAYRSSFFKAIASVRAGNVIGGGDWAKDRLIPDMVRAFIKNEIVLIRNPMAIRPWQHVLEPLRGYLMVAEKLCNEPENYAEAWNFGPYEQDMLAVKDIADQLTKLWGENARWVQDTSAFAHEAQTLKLDIAKVKTKLHWKPKMNLSQTLDYVVSWYKAWHSKKDMRAFTIAQIQQYSEI